MNSEQTKQIKEAITKISEIHHNNVHNHMPDHINQLMSDYLYEVMNIVGNDDVETYIDNAINWDLQFDK